MGDTFPYGARAYADVALRTKVETASPLELTVMLFDGALLSIARARTAMQAGDVQGKAKNIHRAVEIINSGLVASLDPVAGGVLAEQLRGLYEYCARELLLGSLKNDMSKLDGVRELLMKLLSAWKSLNSQPPVAPRTSTATAARSMSA